MKREKCGTTPTDGSNAPQIGSAYAICQSPGPRQCRVYRRLVIPSRSAARSGPKQEGPVPDVRRRSIQWQVSSLMMDSTGKRAAARGSEPCLIESTTRYDCGPHAKALAHVVTPQWSLPLRYGHPMRLYTPVRHCAIVWDMHLKGRCVPGRRCALTRGSSPSPCPPRVRRTGCGRVGIGIVGLRDDASQRVDSRRDAVARAPQRIKALVPEERVAWGKEAGKGWWSHIGRRRTTIDDEVQQHSRGYLASSGS